MKLKDDRDIYLSANSFENNSRDTMETNTFDMRLSDRLQFVAKIVLFRRGESLLQTASDIYRIQQQQLFYLPDTKKVS